MRANLTFAPYVHSVDVNRELKMVWNRVVEKFSTYKVIFAVIMIRIFNRSVTTVFGLLFEALFWRLKSTQVQISFILNLTLVISNVAGIVSGYLTKVISTKTFAVTGTLCVSLGLMMTAYVNNYVIVIFTYSLVVGTGIGLITVSTFLAVVESFADKKTEAIAISSIGGVIGEFQCSVQCIFRFLNINSSLMKAEQR